GWSQLRQWLDAGSAHRAARERLATASAEWVKRGRRNDETWQGPRLDEAAALDPETISTGDREFVAASQRAMRRRQRQRWLVVLGGVALVVLAFLTQRMLARRE